MKKEELFGEATNMQMHALAESARAALAGEAAVLMIAVTTDDGSRRWVTGICGRGVPLDELLRGVHGAGDALFNRFSDGKLSLVVKLPTGDLIEAGCEVDAFELDVRD